LEDPILLCLNLAYSIAALGLAALGLAAVFGLLRVMNMAHGEFITLGAYSVVATQSAGLPWIAAQPIAIGVTAVCGFLVEWALIRHLYRRPFDTLLATWGLSILLRKLVELLFGREFRNVALPISGTATVLGADYPAWRLVLMGIVFGFFAALFLWYRRSNMAARIRAMVGNPELAEAVGLNTRLLATGTFVFGSVMAGVAGAMLAPIVRVEPLMGLDYVVNSFFVLVVGGLGSLEGLFIGTGVIGTLDTAVSSIFDKTSGYTAILVVSILFLWMKPDGLFGRR
jgi:branched-chain amino acid transport system permease protein/urea transport system permease protein